MRLKIIHKIVHKFIFVLPQFLQINLSAGAIVNNARFLCVIVNNALSEFADDR